MLGYENQRPEGGKIVDGIIFTAKYCPFGILYTTSEGGAFEFVGCATEEIADNIMKRFEEQGDMDNPKYYMSELMPPTIKPYTMVKVEMKTSKAWVPNN